jgi:AraC-like DNA-binding protein
MKFELFKPSPPLREYIQFYWLLECTPSAGEAVHRIIPSGLPELIVNYGDRLICSGDDPGYLPPRMLFSGQKNTFYDIYQTGETRLISVLFTPSGAACFFPDSFSGLLNGSVSLDDLFPRDSDRLYDRLCSADGAAGKVAILESFIMEKITPDRRRDYPLVSRVISEIKESGGDITIDAICHMFDINSRYLERRFGDYIGMSPKNFLRVVRFQNVLHRYDKHGGTLTDLSMDCGYYDQSHFIREIREFTGMSPRELFNTCSVHSDFFAC